MLNAIQFAVCNFSNLNWCAVRQPTGVVGREVDCYTEGTEFQSWVRHGYKTVRPSIGGNCDRLSGVFIIKRSPLLALLVGQSLWFKACHCEKKKKSVLYALFTYLISHWLPWSLFSAITPSFPYFLNNYMKFNLCFAWFFIHFFVFSEFFTKVLKFCQWICKNQNIYPLKMNLVLYKFL